MWTAARRLITALAIILVSGSSGVKAARCPSPPACYVCSASQAVCKLCPDDAAIPATITGLKIMPGGCSNLASRGLLMASAFSRYTQLETLSLNNVHVMHFFGPVFKANTRLRVLSMAQNNIRSFSAQTFEGLANLEQLVLALSNIRAILPASFKELVSLKELNMAGNNLTTLKSHDFDGLSKLEKLNMASNPIASIEAGTFQPLTSLVSLDISEMRLTSLPAQVFVSMPSLKTVDASSNQISTVAPDAFLSTSLDLLDLSDNKLTQIPTLAVQQAAGAPKFLDLENNRITAVTAQDFQGVTIRELKLRGNPITVIDTGAFFGSHIDNMDLRDTRLTSTPPDLESIFRAAGTVLNMEGVISWECDCRALGFGRFLNASKGSKPPTCRIPRKFYGYTVRYILTQLEIDCASTTTTSTTTTTTATTTTPSTTRRSQAKPVTTAGSSSQKLHVSNSANNRPGGAVTATATKTPGHPNGAQSPAVTPSAQSPGKFNAPGPSATRGTGTTGTGKYSHSGGKNNSGGAKPSNNADDGDDDKSDDNNSNNNEDAMLIALAVMSTLALGLAIVGVVTACVVCKKQRGRGDRKVNHAPSPTNSQILWKGRMEAIHGF